MNPFIFYCPVAVTLEFLLRDMIFQGFRLEFSELREYTHGFFSNVAELLEDGFSQVLFLP